MTPLTRLHWIVNGRVQGVGYRWFVRDNAAKLQLSGWVRNLPDGTVEIEAEGKKTALDALRKLLESGHPYAHVDHIEASTLTTQGGPNSFDIH